MTAHWFSSGRVRPPCLPRPAREAVVPCLLGATLLLVPGLLSAQNAGEPEPVQTQVEIKKLRVLTRETPQFPDELADASGSDMDWILILAEYETEVSRGDYTDELEFAWSVGLLPRRARPIVMKREVRYIDIQEGDHYVAMYIRPRFLIRYYGDDNIRRNTIKVYLEVRDRGEVIYRFHYPEERPEPVRDNTFWWQLAEPQVRRFDAELLTRLETPFAPLEFNFYEYIKPERYD